MALADKKTNPVYGAFMGRGGYYLKRIILK